MVKIGFSWYRQVSARHIWQSLLHWKLSPKDIGRCSCLVAECHKAEAKGTVARLIKKWTRPDLIVLDELGCFPFDEFSANIFFQVISKRCEHGAMILTSNNSFIEWRKIFGDDVLATAILDRLLHHSVTFNIEDDSYRLKEKKKAEIYQATSLEK